MLKILCVSERENPREDPNSWKRKAKSLTKMREKQADQAQGEALSGAVLPGRGNSSNCWGTANETSS